MIGVRVATAALAALLALALVPAGCGTPAAELRGRTMGTTYSIKCFGLDSAAAAPVVDATLARINGLFSTYASDSEISRFNAWSSTDPFAASPEFAALVERALRIAAITQGAFDPTVAPLVKLYGFDDREADAPDPDKIAAARALVGYRKLKVLEGHRLAKAVAGLQLDLNAIAKGYGVDAVTEALVGAGASALMVEIGGEVRCVGSKPGGAPWRLGIERAPVTDDVARALLEVVELVDCALATSGGYRNRVGGMHHIFDVATGANPDAAVLSVSVLATTCALADALATAFMVRGVDGAADIVRQVGDDKVGVLFQLRDGADGLRLVRIGWDPPR